MLRYVERSYSNPTALNRKNSDGWQSVSTQEFIESVKAVALGLHQLGLQRGDRVGILSQPSPQWTIAELGVLSAGGVVVPLFANISDENFVYEATHTDLKILFVEGSDQWKVYEKHVDLFDIAIGFDELQHRKAISFQELMDKGKELDSLRPKLYESLQNAIHTDDLALIIYTSGSMGLPKGVELTQANISGVLNFEEFHWQQGQDSYLSILPLAHIFGHCINLWVITWGISIYYYNDYKSVGEVCKEIKPTAMIVVPRLLEKIYAKMTDQLHSTKGIKRRIGELAFKLAKQEKPSLFKKLVFPLFDSLVYSKLRKAFGGRLRIVLSGGAPLNTHLRHFYNEVGIPVYEGYGLTEACPLCVNLPNKDKIGTVGLPILGQNIRISPEGEVLAHGILIMRGYYQDPEATAAAIDEDGWLHTGDRGSLDADGYLTLLGRMKELYKTSTGEYVAPVPIEQALCRHPLVDMAMVVAEGRKFTSCLLFPNHDYLARLKSQQRVENIGDEAFLQGDFVRQEMDKLLHKVNKHLNHWEEIHGYRFILEPLTIEGGELTPSMKIRRDAVAQKFSDLIDAIYHEEGE